MSPTRETWGIWSKAQRSWWRRSPDGGAAGYTHDVREAGRWTLDRAVAMRDGAGGLDIHDLASVVASDPMPRISTARVLEAVLAECGGQQELRELGQRILGRLGIG